MSNGELRRLCEQGAVLLNTERVVINEPVNFPVHSIVFFPSGERRTTIWEFFMARHFTKRHIVNGYAAMGNSRCRPKYAGMNASSGDIKAAIEHERAKASRMARASKK